MSSVLRQHLTQRRVGVPSGIYSVCSAHPWVIRAAADQAVSTESLLLIEATSNQVNQFGGYTGMGPYAFRTFVEEEVRQAGLPRSSLILGGDHLGPNPWHSMPAVGAMKHAAVMVAEYVRAGFTKIHLDASMPCGGDPSQLSDEAVAERALELCQVAEAARPSRDAESAPLYVIGTEVPTPGGATHSLEGLQITTPAAAQQTLETHKRAFMRMGMADAWSRVIALVVQPGVEFDHNSVAAYDTKRAAPLCEWLKTQPDQIVFEAHSTDHQLPQAFRELVQDGFAILKVGPALTYAMREAIFALEDIETQLKKKQPSRLGTVIEEVMLHNPQPWRDYYGGTDLEQQLLRQYSYSDRIRYYWQHPAVSQAVDQLIVNLSADGVPESMCSRYLPAQYARLRQGQIANDPKALIIDKIRDVLRFYAAACNG